MTPPLLLQEVAPIVRGGTEAVGALQGAHAWLSHNILTILASLGVGAGSATLATVLAGALMLGTGFALRKVLLWAFVFVVVFTIVFALGVKLG